MPRLRLSVLALLLTACGGLLDDGEDETASDPEPPPAEAVEQSCQPGERRCSGAVREFCDGDGKSWREIEVCEAPFACDPTHCLPE